MLDHIDCKRCVMDNGDPEIFFDDNGFCNHCNDLINKKSEVLYKGKESDDLLDTKLRKIKEKGKGEKYDCVIGLSGGVDSIYLTYLAKKHWGLRPLAVHLDNGWNARVAVQNIKTALDKLEVDLYTHVLDWHEFKDLQLSFLKASVPDAENPTDMAIPGVLHRAAAKNKIKYILLGCNYATEAILPRSFQYNSKDLKYLKEIQKKFGTYKLKTFPVFGYQQEFFYKIVKGIKLIYPLNDINYSKTEAVKVLENELGWENYGGKHHESIYTKFIQGYYLPMKFNRDYRRATYSTQIITNEITREEAIDLLKIPAWNEQTIEEDIIYLAKKFEIGLDEFKEILNRLPKMFYDYPNDNKKLNFVYKTYRKLYK